MENTFDFRLGIKPRYLYILIASCILVALALMVLPNPAGAAQVTTNADSQIIQTEPPCTPPGDWGQTTRLKVPNKPSKQWSFTVDEPEMDVKLVFFFYQDYSKEGCPDDCSTGECQTDETGKGESPFGEFSVMDGMEGGNRGTKELSGRLAQGTYQVTFTANGNPGSINVGLKVRQEAVPTNTPVPSEVTPPVTDTPVTPEPTEITPEPVDTATPTSKPKRTPPPTLPPPTPIAGSPAPQVLIPQTGFELGQSSSALFLVFISLGLGVVGLGFTFYGIRKRLK